MTKEEYLQLLKLLSALETHIMVVNGGVHRVPERLSAGIQECVKILEREILK